MYMLVSRKNIFQRCFIISQGAADFHLLLLICSIRYLNCLLSGQLKFNYVLFRHQRKWVMSQQPYSLRKITFWWQLLQCQAITLKFKEAEPHDDLANFVLLCLSSKLSLRTVGRSWKSRGDSNLVGNLPLLIWLK